MLGQSLATRAFDHGTTASARLHLLPADESPGRYRKTIAVEYDASRLDDVRAVGHRAVRIEERAWVGHPERRRAALVLMAGATVLREGGGTLGTRIRMLALVGALSVLLAFASALPAQADHSWGSYHWARTSTPFTLRVGDSVTSVWDAYLNEAISDWNPSSVLNLTKVAGASSPRNCRPTAGRIEVCNAKYGNNGWLGIAQIWASGNHITQAVAKMNDTYFSTATYNTPAWRRLVMCQEIAHDFGLDHQDEAFDNANLGTCMDYTNDPDGGAGGAASNDPSNEHPNAHDFDELGSIYAHTDSATTVGQSTASGRSGSAQDEGPNNPADFGRPTGAKDGFGRDIRFEKQMPDGRKILTYVFWTLPRIPGNQP